MGKYSRFEIFGQDRVGIVLDILNQFCRRNINMISMEVFPGRLSIMTHELDPEVRRLLNEDLTQMGDVYSVADIDLLDYEKNEKKLMAVIDSVDEGVIAIDGNYRITIFNSYCEELFGCLKDEVLGTDIRGLIGADTPIEGLVRQGLDYDHLEAVMEREGLAISYVSTGRVIRDDNDLIIGAVASIKDTNKVRELASIISTAEEEAFKEIVGSSPSLERIKKTIRAVARSNSTVMLRGESGTGKELFARALHTLSGREGPYVTLNCAALPETLLESELFGYTKGSFTGASIGGKEGLFKEANEGTLFLDEIGELTPTIQAKLLRVLQEGTVRPIGGSKEEPVNVRVVAATNQNLEEMLKQKLFREDLYYRLNVIPLCIPNLHARREDIPLLVQHFIQKLSRRLGKGILGARPEFMNEMVQRPWPGNIRELQNVVERAMNLCEGEVLSLKDLYLESTVTTLDTPQETDEMTEISLKTVVEQCERDLIQKVIAQEKSCRRAAKRLGVTHTTILNKMKRYGIRM